MFSINIKVSVVCEIFVSTYRILSFLFFFHPFCFIYKYKYVKTLIHLFCYIGIEQLLKVTITSRMSKCAWTDRINIICIQNVYHLVLIFLQETSIFKGVTRIGRSGNLLSFLLRCGTRPYERGTQWD